MSTESFQNLNVRSLQLCQDADLLRLRIHRSQPGLGTLLDFAPDGLGTIEGGILLARICLGDLGTVHVTGPNSADFPFPQVHVKTDHPLNAYIASQYAGWPFSPGNYFAMCSGPARLARGKEELLAAYDLADQPDQVVGVLESRTLPGATEFESFASECGVDPEQVTLCIAPTASLPGAIQIVGRSVETTMHKLHELGFDLRQIKSAIGNAPLPPIAENDLVALGWTNDAILYGAMVQIWVDCDPDQLTEIGPKIPSESSSDFGRPFQQIFESYDQDFYQIDKHLFSPACVSINNIRTGKTSIFGKRHLEILSNSFLG